MISFRRLRRKGKAERREQGTVGALYLHAVLEEAGAKGLDRIITLAWRRGDCIASERPFENSVPKRPVARFPARFQFGGLRGCQAAGKFQERQ